VLIGFEDTDILPFGGSLDTLRLDSSAQVPLTFVPSFPMYPPESVWMRQPFTNVPGLILNEQSSRGRVAFLPADIDRRFARDNLPDHGKLLANLVRWVARDNIPLAVQGPGLVDCHLYRQADHLVLHLVNLTNAGTWRAPVTDLIPIGPLQVRVKLPTDVRPRRAQFLVGNHKQSLHVKDGWATFGVASVLDHEVVVIG